MLVRRWVAAGMVMAAFSIGPATPADAAAQGVATLETEQNIQPPSYGTVWYRDEGLTANRLTVRQAPDGSLTLTDPTSLIVAFRLGTGLNCTGGQGTASCGFSRFFVVQAGPAADVVDLSGSYFEASVFGGGANDQISLRTDAWSRIDCGNGYDTVTTTASVFVEPNCESVTLV